MMKNIDKQKSVPPQHRSLAALGLAFAASSRRFALQICQECSTVQYPPREICGKCLSEQLVWDDVASCGELLAVTVIRVTGDPYFKDLLPWRTGIVKLDCGPSVIAHLHGQCDSGDRVKLVLMLDKAEQGVMFSMPVTDQPDMLSDRQLAQFTRDPQSPVVVSLLQHHADKFKHSDEIWPGLLLDKQKE